MRRLMLAGAAVAAGVAGVASSAQAEAPVALVGGGTGWTCTMVSEVASLQGTVQISVPDPVDFEADGIVARQQADVIKTFTLDAIWDDGIVFLDIDGYAELTLERPFGEDTTAFTLSGWRTKNHARETFGTCEMIS